MKTQNLPILGSSRFDPERRHTNPLNDLEATPCEQNDTGVPLTVPPSTEISPSSGPQKLDLECEAALRDLIARVRQSAAVDALDEIGNAFEAFILAEIAVEAARRRLISACETHLVLNAVPLRSHSGAV